MKKYLKHIIVLVIVLLTLILILNANSKYKRKDANIINDFIQNLGDIGGGILFNSNVVNFSSDSMSSKNVQNAVMELYESIDGGCAPGYVKGTTGDGYYNCNARTVGTTQTEVLASSAVKYDNTNSGLLSTNVDDAIDEIANMIPDCKRYYTKGNVTGSGYTCTANTYTVNYVDNLFVARSQESNDVTAVYTEDGSYLTLNGLSATKMFVDSLWNWERRTFEAGDEYQITIKYVSGSYTRKKNSAESPRFFFELTTGSGALYDDRATDPKSYTGMDMPLSGEATMTYVVPASRASTATGIRYRLYQATASNISFSDYKVQIIVTKLHSQNVSYDSAYGEMDTTSKTGFTFLGWYTGLFDGDRVDDDDINNIPSDQTLYAHYYYHKLHIRYRSTCASTISWCSTSTTYTMDSSCYALRNGDRIISSYGYGQYAGYKNGLMNWNNASSICFYRSGQNGIDTGEGEWKSVATGTEYSMSTIYTAVKLANDEGCSLLENDDCMMTLKVNWMGASGGSGSSGSTCCPNGGTYNGGYCYDDPQSGIGVASCHSLGLYWVGNTCYNVRYTNSC